MEMHDPPHPGEVIRELCLKPLSLTASRAAAARKAGWSSKCTTT